MAILQMLFLILSVLITRGFAEPSAFSSAQTDTTRTTMTSAYLAALKPLLGIPGGAAPRPAVVDPVLTPAMTPNSRPGCSFDFSPCRYDESYPRDKVNLIVDRFYNDITLMYKELHHVSPQDLVYYDNRTHGYRSGGHFVCESRIQYIRPGWARNVHGRLQAILNTDKFPQIIKVERCQYEGRRCEYLPPCYKSSCIQRTSYVKLVALDPEFSSQKPSVEVFEVPTACSCFVEDFTFF
ncbi:neurotrophin 1-like isoform X2 [Oratosquilla oratoria]|uniref:neurotrophin 1-like isoform X2 n=1 Tax=Oratosquilla oratoria TaxID=337810 RepID=UPI003F75E676